MAAEPTTDRRDPGRAPVLATAALLLALAAFWATRIAAANGLWIDELYSLWSSDPALDAAESARRIFGDTNPPLYYFLLRVARIAIEDPRTAFLAVNGVFLAAAIAAVAALGGRVGRRWALLLGAAFVATGGVLFFAAEGRTYFAGAAAVLVAASLAFAAAASPAERPPPAAFAVAGALSSQGHLFAALLCGGLAAGLVTLSVVRRRRDLLAPGLLLGTTATLSTLAFLAWGMRYAGRISWIRFDDEALSEAIRVAGPLVFGSREGLALFAAVLALAALPRTTRDLATLCAIALAVFLAVPVAISQVQPLIVPRYLVVAAPVVPVFLVFVARGALRSGTTAGRGLAGLAGLALLVAAATGGEAAARFTAEKMTWRGAGTVGRLAVGCQPRSIRVGRIDWADPLAAYALASGLPADLFVADPDESLASGCPVAGWVEHDLSVEIRAPASPETDRALIRRLGLSGPPESYEIRRHRTGYVVLAPPAAPAGPAG